MAKGKYGKWITEEGLVLLEGWARDGLTEEQIAHNVGVSRSTLNDWKKKYPDISDALKKGKEVVDLQVENALLKRALGYEYEEVTQESQWNEKSNKYELVVTKRVKKRQAPDTTAQIFWLKNRRPDKWRDKQDVEHTGDMDLNIVIDYGEDDD
ncbi:helix-turn-helix domain-containing protein [Priestia megaterium]|uniref:transposase n=1 Tax=Priestia megaterium TaxID=1404 RepID=UPI002E24D149|nr:transposase [Priestia megaterium]MED4135732.1 helix-turn-helix domain-containing protein [Priestia megaterium]